MMISRRDVVMGLPALAAAGTVAHGQQNATLPGKVYHAAQIPYTGNEKKKGRARRRTRRTRTPSTRPLGRVACGRPLAEFSA